MKKGLPLAILGAAFGAGCALVLGIEDKPVVIPEEGGVTGEADAADAAPTDLCAHRRPPPPPVTDDDEATKATFVVASRSFDFAGANDAGAIGYDLDDSCTCASPVGARHGAGPSCTSTSKSCDREGGVDNAAAGLSFITAATSAEKGKDKSVQCGRTALILVIQGYNGMANDTAITLGPVLSPGLQTPHDPPDAGEKPSDCNADGGGLPVVYAPRWDGTDRWSSDTSFVLPGTAQPKRLLEGYVRDWTLVARANAGANPLITVALGPFTVESSQALFVAQLEPLDADGRPLSRSAPGTRAKTVRISAGQIAVRTSATSVLQALSGLPVETFGARLCPGNPLFKSFKDVICAELDVMKDPAQDFGGAACDAISAGVAFVAEPARVQRPDAPLDAGLQPCSDVPPTCD